MLFLRSRNNVTAHKRTQYFRYNNAAVCLLIIFQNSCNSTSFTPAALNTKPTAIKAITKNPISLENSRLNPRYTPITAIAISTKLCALDKNQLYKSGPKFSIFCSFPSLQFLCLRLLLPA